MRVEHLLAVEDVIAVQTWIVRVHSTEFSVFLHSSRTCGMRRFRAREHTHTHKYVYKLHTWLWPRYNAPELTLIKWCWYCCSLSYASGEY